MDTLGVGYSILAEAIADMYSTEMVLHALVKSSKPDVITQWTSTRNTFIHEAHKSLSLYSIQWLNFALHSQMFIRHPPPLVVIITTYVVGRIGAFGPAAYTNETTLPSVVMTKS